ncbi:unnamed protein product [Sphagnum balticum]
MLHFFVFTECSERGTIFGLYAMIVLAMLFGAHTFGEIRAVIIRYLMYLVTEGIPLANKSADGQLPASFSCIKRAFLSSLPYPRQSHQSPGALGERIYLPPLFGQVVAGVLLRNVPWNLNYGSHINMSTAGVLKKLAFVSLLLKAGISMDVAALKRAKCWSGLRMHI